MLEDKHHGGAIDCVRSQPVERRELAADHRTLIPGQLQQLDRDIATDGIADPRHCLSFPTTEIQDNPPLTAKTFEQGQDISLIDRIVTDLLQPPLGMIYPFIAVNLAHGSPR
jgi:hypothetical protein